MNALGITVEIFKVYGTWFAVLVSARAPLRQRCPIAWDVDLEEVVASLKDLRIFENQIQNVGEIKEDEG